MVFKSLVVLDGLSGILCSGTRGPGQLALCCYNLKRKMETCEVVRYGV